MLNHVSNHHANSKQREIIDTQSYIFNMQIIKNKHFNPRDYFLTGISIAKRNPSCKKTSKSFIPYFLNFRMSALQGIHTSCEKKFKQMYKCKM